MSQNTRTWSGKDNEIPTLKNPLRCYTLKVDMMRLNRNIHHYHPLTLAQYFSPRYALLVEHGITASKVFL